MNAAGCQTVIESRRNEGFVPNAQVEFILMGGTFMSLPLDYRDYFVRNLHDALSGHSSASVYEAVRFSEQSRTKCIGLTIETRPDYCLTPHLTQVCLLPCYDLRLSPSCLAGWLVARLRSRARSLEESCNVSLGLTAITWVKSLLNPV